MLRSRRTKVSWEARSALRRSELNRLIRESGGSGQSQIRGSEESRDCFFKDNHPNSREETEEMPREAYNDRRRYDVDEGDARSSRNKDSYGREERYSSSSRDYRDTGRRGIESQSRDMKRSAREREEDTIASSSSLQVNRSRKRSSKSPDFERDRAKERKAYDRRRGSRSEERDDGEEQKKAEEAVFEASGLLAKESNSKNGVALKYAEPPEARISKKKWRLYVFKDGKEIDVLHISRQSCYLMGRDRAVADIPIDHPSISKQHAVIQFRNIRQRNEYGDEKQSVKPFLIDLDSANGCVINDAEVPPSRYYEMRNGDTLKLGGSQREYVLLAEV